MVRYSLSGGYGDEAISRYPQKIRQPEIQLPHQSSSYEIL